MTDPLDEKSIVKFLTDVFAFRKEIILLGLKNHNYSFHIDIAVNGSEGKEKQKLGEFLGELRETDVPDTVVVFYKDPWKNHPSHNSKSVHLIETADSHWKYRIYFVDTDSAVHDIISQEAGEVLYYKLLLLKSTHLEKIVDKYFPRDSDLVSLEKKLKRKLIKKHA